MIPPFNENGYLPPGIHEATLSQIKNRYVYNPIRTRLFEGLRKLTQVLKRSGCKTVYLDGSYITSKEIPNDFDATWECDGVDNTIDPLLRDGLNNKMIRLKYSGDVVCQIPGYFDYIEFFQTDDSGIRKGIIKIDLEKLAI